MKNFIGENNEADIAIENLYKEYPNVKDFFIAIGIRDFDKSMNAKQIISTLDIEYLEESGSNKKQILHEFLSFIEKMKEIKNTGRYTIKSITVIGGHDKSGIEEDVKITFKPGEIICIVGHTGSGKSRLLEDIECLAQKDTPTGRQILVNGSVPEENERFSMDNKLVAQLSQNMNFVMDVTVEEFITMHAESRMVDNVEEIVESIIKCANDLAGEKFLKDVPVTQLSGGQSRALMIADTALLSKSPIVLIDEIENAGIDRKMAIEVLMKEEKIILMSTHDPILALIGNKRMVIKNGGIKKIIETNSKERSNVDILEKFDAKLVGIRNKLREGETIDFDIKKYFKID
ncbi:ATP-binding cassette domain-containing protein [Clostridium tyrobutyricum]|jgi:ABC-type lipoprotein export system ATPase subunit|uniref:Uncharacterized ABC transporter ATP-binding protein MJ0121 n=1 Tax=Clostridium tyrobutyricum DIVETGP TaxID=1408889 RepID=W6NEY0_CLOTY|nr:ATP-binding cassette domain-containing protein [Clostridium tyrobutyricum]AND84100.1 ABC transporter ATPase [Clostridium tyrobutyricum]ANP68829.1 ABC transporter [Clostridium tyrobutyricum]MBR9647241.1 ABC transporter ATP-binding protein [Clostridium tyrobutyricum]MBV4417355.1 ATP-binding cassette domain-containing protein [Clostridium tyrobutyricum]MBV4422892.1 ATP-binding cassette domain-containing protein [Clostridium tyrobutyricum]